MTGSRLSRWKADQTADAVREKLGMKRTQTNVNSYTPEN